jgi:hypothetical protein
MQHFPSLKERFGYPVRARKEVFLGKRNPVSHFNFLVVKHDYKRANKLFLLIEIFIYVLVIGSLAFVFTL